MKHNLGMEGDPGWEDPQLVDPGLGDPGVVNLGWEDPGLGDPGVVKPVDSCLRTVTGEHAPIHGRGQLQLGLGLWNCLKNSGL